MYEILKSAIQALARNCDGAVKDDQVGFTKYDCDIGFKLAQKRKWTFEDADRAYFMIQKYHKQIKIDEIPKPTKEFSMEEIEKFHWTLAIFIEKNSKWVRECSPIPKGFFDYRMNHKDELYAKGISISKFDNKWKITWWTQDKPEEKEGKCGFCGKPYRECYC